MFKNFKSVEKCVYGRGSFNQMDDILAAKRKKDGDFMVFLVDDVFKEDTNIIRERIPLHKEDMQIWIHVDKEPTTELIDSLRDRILAEKGLPAGVIGIGGGSVMDIAKALSLMLTNPGSSVLYQGLNLIKIPGVYHLGVPTLSGTGAEVSMTAVLTGPTKKLGLKCDYTIFDQIILDPELIRDAPIQQRFYTGMDTYLHCIESLSGTLLNEFSKSFGEKSVELCQEVFLNKNLSREEADDKLMVASYMGGLSLTYAEVGACHALSYGLSYVFGTPHCLANCIVFEVLEDYYGAHVDEFRKLVSENNISLPKNLAKDWTEEQIDAMAEVAIKLEHMWNNVAGKNWKEVITKEKIKALYRRM